MAKEIEIDNPEEPEPGAVDAKLTTSPYSGLPFNLELQELGQSGTQKMMLGEMARLNRDNAELSTYREKYHVTDKKLAVLGSKFQRYVMLEILYTVGIALASIIFGWLTSATVSDTVRNTAIGLALGLLLAAMAAKYMGVRLED